MLLLLKWEWAGVGRRKRNKQVCVGGQGKTNVLRCGPELRP